MAVRMQVTALSLGRQDLTADMNMAVFISKNETERR